MGRIHIQINLLFTTYLNSNIGTVLTKSSVHNTRFLAWMEANKKYSEAKNLTLNFHWNTLRQRSDKHQWFPRKRGFAVGRLHYTPLGSGEIYYLNYLLNHVEGPFCFEDIRTVNIIVHETFKKACYAMGLIDDDKWYIHTNTINEASLWGTASYLRKLFGTLLLANQLSISEYVWKKTSPHLSDDILSHQRVALQFQGNFLNILFDSIFVFKWNHFNKYINLFFLFFFYFKILQVFIFFLTKNEK